MAVCSVIDPPYWGLPSLFQKFPVAVVVVVVVGMVVRGVVVVEVAVEVVGGVLVVVVVVVVELVLQDASSMAARIKILKNNQINLFFTSFPPSD